MKGICVVYNKDDLLNWRNKRKI